MTIFVKIGYIEQRTDKVTDVTDITDNVTDNVTDVTNNVTDNRMEKILTFIKKDRQITINEISKKLNVTKRTIFRDIEKLKQNNKLQRIGTEKSGHWEVIQ